MNTQYVHSMFILAKWINYTQRYKETIKQFKSLAMFKLSESMDTQDKTLSSDFHKFVHNHTLSSRAYE